MIIITVLLALFFTFARSIKITGWQKFIFETQLTFFNKYGLKRVHMFLVGILELSAAILLLASLIFEHKPLNDLGAVTIALTSIGAIFFHLRFDTIKDAVPAIVTLLLSLALIVSNQAPLGVFSLS